MTSSCIYFGTYVLQQDMRVRLPKAILTNLDAEKGNSQFDIFLDKDNNEVILKIKTNDDQES